MIDKQQNHDSLMVTGFRNHTIYTNTIDTKGALKMRDWKMLDWNYREQETYGTPRVA